MVLCEEFFLYFGWVWFGMRVWGVGFGGVWDGGGVFFVLLIFFVFVLIILWNRGFFFFLFGERELFDVYDVCVNYVSKLYVVFCYVKWFGCKFRFFYCLFDVEKNY